MIRAVGSLLGIKGSLIVVATVLAVVGGWGELRYFKGKSAGKAVVEAQVGEKRQEVQSQVYGLSRVLAERSAGLAQAKAKRAQRTEELENEASKDNPAGRVPSADSLQRLRLRWDRN